MIKKQKPSKDTSSKQAQSAHAPETIREAISAALDETLKSMHALLRRLLEPPTTQQHVIEAMPKMLDLAQRTATLFRLAHPSDKPLSSESAVRLAALWRETNAPEPEIEKALRMAGKRHRGRPTKLRSAALQALEFLSAYGGRAKWKAAAERFCPCGDAQHGFKCQQNLRREVLLLKSSLRSLGVSLPVR